MTKKLYLLRHGKSDWSIPVSDFDRPILDRGKRAAQRMGAWMYQQGEIPQQVISSPAVRTKTTAEKCLKAMGQTTENLHYDKQLYLASVKDFIKVIKKVSESVESLMLVSHNFGLEDLIHFLNVEEVEIPEDGKLMPTACLAIFTIDVKWAEIAKGSADLVDIIRPKSLPKKFPFPLANPVEYRKRPAYYYQQSSVIPYRFINNQLEVLLVMSSQKKHLVVPKGIVEPGLSQQDSAAKEACEEAGVKGLVSQDSIGDYEYEKWGASTRVTVYTMKVTKELSKKQWQESHRERFWLSPEAAAKKIKQVELKPLLLKLEHVIMKG